MNDLTLTSKEIKKLKKLAAIFDYVGEIDGSVCVTVKGEFRLISEKDIILISGGKDNDDRPGYKHSIWLNPPLNEDNNPQIMIGVQSRITGEILNIPAIFDEEGNAVIPMEYTTHITPLDETTEKVPNIDREK